VVRVVPTCFVEEIRRVHSVAKFGDWVPLGSVGSTHKQDPYLQGTKEKAEFYMTVF
jgi:hypothetical protein